MAPRLAVALWLGLQPAFGSGQASSAVALSGTSLALGEDESFALLQHAAKANRTIQARSAEGADSFARPIMKNVRAAFSALSRTEGKVLQANIGGVPVRGYNKGTMPYSEHFQSIQRMQGTTAIYLSGSGQTSKSGQIFILDMGSRPKEGAMGSNMLSSRKPPTQDTLKGVMNIDNEYWHAGGMTSFENILAIGCEPGCVATDRAAGRCKPAGRIHFFDTTVPSAPKRLPFVVERSGVTAGTTALTKQADGKYLLCVGGSDAEQLDFYLSQKTTLMDGDPGFHLIRSWNKKSLLVDAGSDSTYNAYQTMNFIQQEDGKLFIVGLFRSAGGLGSDYADLFRVDTNSKGISMIKQGQIKLACASGTCNFQAGAGIYIASPTVMLIYASDWEPKWKDKAIYVNEFRPKW